MAIKFGRPLEARTRFTPVEADAPASAAVKLDLAVRMRRNRRALESPQHLAQRLQA